MPIPAGLVALAAGSGIGSTIGNIFGTMHANNVADRQFQENLAFAKYQYNDMKRWNHPKNQVRMLREAGINPALAYSGGYSGTPISGVSGASPTASMSAPNFDALSSIPSGLASLSQADTANKQSEANIKLMNSETDKNVVETAGQTIDNMYKHEDWISKIIGQKESNWLMNRNAKLAGLDIEYQSQSLGDRLMQMRWSSEYQRALTEAQLIANSYLPQEKAQEIAVKIANQKMLLATGKATLQSASADLMRTYAQYGGTKEDRAKFFNATLDALQEGANLSRSSQYGNWFKGVTSANIPLSVGTYQAGEVVNRQQSVNKHLGNSTPYTVRLRKKR